MLLLMVGFGSVATATLTMWESCLQHLPITYLVVIEPRDLSCCAIISRYKAKLRRNFVHDKVSLTKFNYERILEKYEGSDLLLNLSICTDSFDLLRWAQGHNMMYIDTAQEDWKIHHGKLPKDNLYDRTLHSKHRAIAREKFKENGPTAVLDSGMNPGLISHFAKIALEECAKEAGVKPVGKHHSYLAKQLNLQAIHCSERDTQVSMMNKELETFYNTWCPIGFFEEATDPVQLGWGSHEKKLEEEFFKPPLQLEGNDGRVRVTSKRGKDQIFLPRQGMDVKIRSWEPISGEFEGYAISHGEAASLSRYLATTTYRPSVYYVYLPCQAAIDSLNEVRQNDYTMLPNNYVYKSRDIAGGYDAVGALLMFGELEGDVSRCVWHGTIVDNETARRISPEINATCLQVAGGVLSAVDYCSSNPRRGVMYPEGLDSRRALDIARPCLGRIEFQSTHVAWQSFDFANLQVM